MKLNWNTVDASNYVLGLPVSTSFRWLHYILALTEFEVVIIGLLLALIVNCMYFLVVQRLPLAVMNCIILVQSVSLQVNADYV